MILFKDKSTRSVSHTRISHHFVRSVRPSPANYGESPFFSPLTSQVKPNSVFSHAPSPATLEHCTFTLCLRNLCLFFFSVQGEKYIRYNFPRLDYAKWFRCRNNHWEYWMKNTVRPLGFPFLGAEEEDNRQECSIHEIKVCKI